MNLTLSPDQEQLLGSIVTCLDGELPVSRLHEAETSREQAELRRMRVLGDLGWYRISLPEHLGGAGLGLAEEVLLFREFGRRLAPASVTAAVLGGRIAANGGASVLAESILCGAHPVAIAIPEAPVDLTEGRLRGAVRTFSTGVSDLAVLVTPKETVLLDLSVTTSGNRPCLDRTMTMRRADLGAAEVVARIDGETASTQAQLLLAATFTGQAEAARDMINEYAKVRETFGRAIGAYQAVRHPIAEMAMRCEQAKALLFYAALAADEGRLDAAVQAGAARAVAQTAAVKNDDANIQLHGGIGVTDDLDAHLYLKRTMVCANWFGDVKQQLMTLLEAPLLEI